MPKMSYNGFPFPYNPETYTATQEKSTTIYPLPGLSAQVQVPYSEPQKITGTGAFVGPSADRFQKNILSLFKMKKSGVLVLPQGDSINAFFIRVKLIGDGKAGLLRYEFTFLEDTGNGSGVFL